MGKNKLLWGENVPIVVEAVYENGILKPVKKLNLPEKSRVLIKVEVFGLLKDWDVDPQKLKDELREVHG